MLSKPLSRRHLRPQLSHLRRRCPAANPRIKSRGRKLMSAQGIFNCGSFSENRWLALDKHAKSDIIHYSPPDKPYRHSIKTLSSPVFLYRPKSWSRVHRNCIVSSGVIPIPSGCVYFCVPGSFYLRLAVIRMRREVQHEETLSEVNDRGRKTLRSCEH